MGEFTSRTYSRILADLYRSYDRDGAATAISKIDGLLSQSDTFPEYALRNLRLLRERWIKANDPSYKPPMKNPEEARPLRQRARDALLRGDAKSSIRNIWTYLQHCSIGTVSFSEALSDLADGAALAGDLVLAQRVVEVFLAHYLLTETAAANELTPVGWDGPEGEDGWDSARKSLRMFFPVEAGIIGIAHDTAPCWRQLLELALERSPFRGKRHQRLRSALITYYEQRSDWESVQRLRGDDPG